MTGRKARKLILGGIGSSLILAAAATHVHGEEPTRSEEAPIESTDSRSTTATDPYGLDRARLGVQGLAQSGLSSSPRPSASVQRRYDRYIEGVIDADNTLDAIIGRPRILILRHAPVRVQIPDEEIARFDILSDREISVTGLNVGSTMLNIWFSNPNKAGEQEILSYLVRVLPDPETKARIERDFRVLEEELNTVFTSSIVKLTLIGDSILVEGEARDALEAEQIIDIIESNAEYVTGAVPYAEDTLEGAASKFGAGAVQENTGTTGRFRVVNLMTIPGASQVALKVLIAEVNRSAARSIGMDFSIQNDAGDSVVASLTAAATGAVANIPVMLDNGRIQLEITALRGMKLARALAEPTLVALNGESASFLAGGEFPVPVVTGATATGLQGVEFVPFGVMLTFTPTILDRDRIRLFLRGEVSTRSLQDGGGGAAAGGGGIPNLNTRNFETTVEMRSGQTLAIAGLIQQNFGSDGDRVPGLGDLPIFGALFGHNRTSSSEQELIVVVTPTLVLPMDPDLVPTHLPGSDVFEPDDIEFYLLNRLESKHTQDSRQSALTTPDRLGRQRQLEQQFIVGPTGHADGR